MDIFNFQRFLDAQACDYELALREIKNGHKQSHWVWYIFPQLKGFGRSYNSEYYGINGLEEAKAYYAHPVLGPRLIEITEALLEHKGKSAVDILSPIDARKVKSCMTLFWIAVDNPLFKTVIDVFYEGQMDNRTISKIGGTTASSDTSKTTNMRDHQNPFKVEHLDFMIVDKAIRYTPKGRFTEGDGGVIALYNFFGRWFSKQFIIDRINYINEASQKEGKHIPSYMDANGYFQNAFQELHELYKNKCKAEENEDKSKIISIDTEIILEINNLCHFNEPRKMYGLFKKYLFPESVEGNWGVYFKTFESQRLEGSPKQLLFFHWETDGTPQLLCFMCAVDKPSYSVFDFDYANTNSNDFGNHRLGEYGWVKKVLNLNKIINYSGSDYVPMFRMDGDSITCCNPPLIRHKYRLMPLFVPGSNFVFDTKPEYFDKYYDLYHSGNWNAKHAIERGGFNLNG